MIPVLVFIALLYWLVTVVLPVLAKIRSGQAFKPWVKICAQVSLFSALFCLFLTPSPLAILFSPPLLAAGVVGVIGHGFPDLLWLLAPSIGIACIVTFTAFMLLRHRLSGLKTFAMLTVFTLAAIATMQVISTRAMAKSAKVLGGEIIRALPVTFSIKQGFSFEDHKGSHAILRKGDQIFLWSYQQKSFLPYYEQN